MRALEWKTHNPQGGRRVVVTKDLPGSRWLEILAAADCRVEICLSEEILSMEEIEAALAPGCDGVIGQLTEEWGTRLFGALARAGGKVYSNYAVGYNNLDLDAASSLGLPVGNTPGVLTEATAEMCLALAMAAGRRLGEGERFMRAGRYQGWLPTLMVGELFWGRTLGIVGAGRIGAALAKMLAGACRMRVLYFDPQVNQDLEDYIAGLAAFMTSRGEPAPTCRRCEQLDELLAQADLVSLNTVLDAGTHHLINARRLGLMKKNAILVNASRGPVVDEAALVAHCQAHPSFRAGLDVFENEPALAPGLSELENVVLAPHIASATAYSRQGMATLAAANVAGVLLGHPAWNQPGVEQFLDGDFPPLAPSILNASTIGYPLAPSGE